MTTIQHLRQALAYLASVEHHVEQAERRLGLAVERTELELQAADVDVTSARDRIRGIVQRLEVEQREGTRP